MSLDDIVTLLEKFVSELELSLGSIGLSFLGNVLNESQLISCDDIGKEKLVSLLTGVVNGDKAEGGKSRDASCGFHLKKVLGLENIY